MANDTTDPLAVADAMMKERRERVKTLAKLADEKTALQAKTNEIEAQEADAYELALASGWSQPGLKKWDSLARMDHENRRRAQTNWPRCSSHAVFR